MSDSGKAENKTKTTTPPHPPLKRGEELNFVQKSK